MFHAVRRTALDKKERYSGTCQRKGFTCIAHAERIGQPCAAAYVRFSDPTCGIHGTYSQEQRSIGWDLGRAGVKTKGPSDGSCLRHAAWGSFVVHVNPWQQRRRLIWRSSHGDAGGVFFVRRVVRRGAAELDWLSTGAGST